MIKQSEKAIFAENDEMRGFKVAWDTVIGKSAWELVDPRFRGGSFWLLFMTNLLNIVFGQCTNLLHCERF